MSLRSSQLKASFMKIQINLHEVTLNFNNICQGYPNHSSLSLKAFHFICKIQCLPYVTDWSTYHKMPLLEKVNNAIKNYQFARYYLMAPMPLIVLPHIFPLTYESCPLFPKSLPPLPLPRPLGPLNEKAGNKRRQLPLL